jgi:lysophospholipase L1-like esterase
MISIWTLVFWRAALERAIKTFGQTGAAMLTAAGTGLLETDWQTCTSVAGMAAVISLLTSVGSDFLTNGTGPSLTDAEGLTLTFDAEVVEDGPAHRGAVYYSGPVTYTDDAEGRRRARQQRAKDDERGASDLVVLGVVFLFALVILIATGVLR